MMPNNDPAQEPAIFSAVLTPNRSLSRKGFLIFMLVLGSLSLTSGLYFLSAGAWPRKRAVSIICSRMSRGWHERSPMFFVR